MNKFFQTVQVYLAEEASRDGGHTFEITTLTDTVRTCWQCGTPQPLATNGDGTIEPCAGLTGYGDDTDRVYLLLSLYGDTPRGVVNFVVRSIRESGIGRLPLYGARLNRAGDQLVIESAPSVVDKLAALVDDLEHDIRADGEHVAIRTHQRLTAAEGLGFLATTYDRYRDRPELAEAYR
jgi:hypothetical protein